MKKSILFVIILSIFCFGCSAKDAGIQFKGKVVFNSFEGGFWGVVTDKGKKLDGTIPKKFQVEDLRVNGSYQERKNVASIHMWGNIVKFLKIERE